jgi:hypothetical protein
VGQKRPRADTLNTDLKKQRKTLVRKLTRTMKSRPNSKKVQGPAGFLPTLD